MTDSIQIPLSKTKLFLLLATSCIITASAVWMLVKPPVPTDFFYGSKFTINLIGTLSILFFGTAILFYINKLRDSKPGLTISHEGLTDHSSAVSAGLIPWQDILQIKEVSVFQEKFLMIIVANPNDYIDKQTSRVKRKAMEINYQMYGSPIGLSANSLQIRFRELKELLEKKYTQYK